MFLKGQFTPWTVKSDHGWWWPFFMVRLPWFNFFKYQFTKPLGPSLSVERKWTKQMTIAPKSECVDCVKYMPTNGRFGRKIIIKLDHLFLFSCLHLLFPQKIIKCCIIIVFLSHGPLPFPTRAPLFPLAPKKPVGSCRWIM